MANIFERASIAGAQVAVREADRALPKGVRSVRPLARQLLFKGPEGLANTALDLALERYGVGLSKLTERKDSFYGPIDLLGGLTFKEAREVFEESLKLDLAKKNLFLVRVSNMDASPTDFDVNFFAVDVSYPGFTSSAEPVRIGSGQMDQVIAQEQREIRISTFDDRYGSIKRWFLGRAKRMTRSDGTVGLPMDYLIRLEILHAYPFAFLADGDGYVDSFVVRPGSIDLELSRRDDAMTELQLSFTQWDTFSSL